MERAGEAVMETCWHCGAPMQPVQSCCVTCAAARNVEDETTMGLLIELDSIETVERAVERPLTTRERAAADALALV
jgi:hypothetical protein